VAAEVPEVDWTAPTGTPGEVEVAELVRFDALGRSSRAEPLRCVDLAVAEVAGRSLRCSAIGWRRTMLLDGEVVAMIDVERRPDQVREGGWTRPLELDGAAYSVSVRTDATRGSRLRGALRYLHVDGETDHWVWHFVGGRLAGERLVLSRGDRPGGEAVVTTCPAGQGRSLGEPRGGATFDRHVTSWTAAAELREVVLAELLTTARLDGLVDYRAARIAEGVQELTGYVPRMEGNTE
jgi:hypothetical protein